MDDDVIPWLKTSEKIETRNNEKKIVSILFLTKYIDDSASGSYTGCGSINFVLNVLNGTEKSNIFFSKSKKIPSINVNSIFL